MTKKSFFNTQRAAMWGMAVLLGHGLAMPHVHGDSSMAMSSWGHSSQSSSTTSRHKDYTETVTTKRTTENGTETETTITDRRYDDGREETTTQTKSMPHRQAKAASSLNNYAVHTQEKTEGDERIHTTTETWQEGSVQVTKITTKVTNTVNQAETTTVKETRAPLASGSATSPKTAALPTDGKHASSAPDSAKEEEHDDEEEDEDDEDDEEEKDEKEERENKKEEVTKVQKEKEKQALKAQGASRDQQKMEQAGLLATLASKGAGSFHQRPRLNVLAHLFQDPWWSPRGWGKDFFSSF